MRQAQRSHSITLALLVVALPLLGMDPAQASRKIPAAGPASTTWWTRTRIQLARIFLPADKAQALERRLLPPPPKERSRFAEAVTDLIAARRALATSDTDKALDLTERVLWPAIPLDRPQSEPTLRRKALKVARAAAEQVFELPAEVRGRGGEVRHKTEAQRLLAVKTQLAAVYAEYVPLMRRLSDLEWHPWNGVRGESSRVDVQRMLVYHRLRRAVTAAKGLYPKLPWELYMQQAGYEFPALPAQLASRTGPETRWGDLLSGVPPKLLR
ncbi:MAG: hypothetical protein IT371_27605 [Deltaproteobacteria bacterium]|nr:hypothetical protein [Deltaproteobacteria bacterium]